MRNLLSEMMLNYNMSTHRSEAVAEFETDKDERTDSIITSSIDEGSGESESIIEEEELLSEGQEDRSAFEM